MIKSLPAPHAASQGNIAAACPGATMTQSIEELEQQAADCSRRGDLQTAERVCREILVADGKHLSSLRFLADLALRAGDFPEAEMRLRGLVEQSPGDLRALSQLAQALYRQGKLSQALETYLQLWRADPRKGLIYLTIGCLYLELGEIDKAAQVFSLGESQNGELLHLWERADTAPAVAAMSNSAWETLRRHHTDLHLAAVDAMQEPSQTGRIRAAIWPLLDAREVSYDHPLHRPQVFSIQHRRSPAFFEPDSFPWAGELEARFPAIRAEILAGLDVAADGRPYLGDGHRLEGEQWKPLVNTMNWASVHLYSRGVANRQLITRFPATLEALRQVPLATQKGNPGEVFLSVLAPRTVIPEHYGVSNAVLTVHLPIVVPPGCGLQVHDETRTPAEGKLLIFDDTWQHRAWNNSDQQRVVLIFELWHPDLSEGEKLAVSRSFEAREQWLRQRKVD